MSQTEPKSATFTPGNPGAEYMPQGTCPKPWVAFTDDGMLRDKRRAVKRFKTEEAALKAAIAKATGEAQ